MDAEGDLTGRQLGSYRLEAPVGEGELSRVYRARREGTDQPFALRVVRSDLAADPQIRERLLAAARAAAALQHPAIVPVEDCGVEDGLLYVAMEYVESLTLSEHLNRLPMHRRSADRTVRRCVQDIAGALDHAHAHGVVHGALKPANVLVRTREGGAVVTDFGLAAARSASDLTLARRSIAVHAYLAPEQWHAQRDPTPACDVFAFAAMLHEVAVGEPSLGRVLAAIAGHPERPVPPLHLTAPELPVRLGTVLAKGLAPLPADRPRSAGELATAFLGALDGPTNGTRSPDETVMVAFDPHWTPPPATELDAEPARPSRPPLPVPSGRSIAAATVVALSAGALFGVTWAVQRLPSPAAAHAAPALPRPVRGVPGTAMQVGSLRLTVLPASPGAPPPPSLSLGPGERFLVIGVEYDNEGRTPAIVSPYDWTLTDAAGVTYGAVDVAGALPQRELPPRQTARGRVGFVVPAAARGLVATFSAEPTGDSARVPLP